MNSGGIIVLGIAVAILLSIISVVLVRASSKKSGTSTPSPTPAPVAPGPSIVGQPLPDASQGGACSSAMTRSGAACSGGFGSESTQCTALRPCPTYSWMGQQNYVVGKIDKPTGITSSSASISGGLDPPGILSLVNGVRAKVGMQPLVWDDRLACAAAAWVPMAAYETCPHGAAPGFPYYAQIVAGGLPTQTPMQVAKTAIEKLFYEDEKVIADAAKVSTNPTFVSKNTGWKLCTSDNIPDSKYGHYCILCSSTARSCGFAIGRNKTGSGFTTTHLPDAPVIVGHFA